MWTLNQIGLTSHLVLGLESASTPAEALTWLAAADSDILCVTAARTHAAGPSLDPDVYRDFVVFLNTTGLSSAEQAVRRADQFLTLASPRHLAIKLEFYGPRKTSIDIDATLRGIEFLVRRGFTVMPHLPAEEEACRNAVDAGAHGLRVVGSPLGSLRGIESQAEIATICTASPVPVIVDGGIGDPQDAHTAARLGASGVLVNTAISVSKDPVPLISRYREACEEAFGRRTHDG